VSPAITETSEDNSLVRSFRTLAFPGSMRRKVQLKKDLVDCVLNLRPDYSNSVKPVQWNLGT